jgi:DNA-damage-inducible protein J
MQPDVLTVESLFDKLYQLHIHPHGVQGRSGNMATHTDKIQARIEPTLKTAAESILRKVGLSSTDAIRLFYKQVELRKGLPFAVEIPNRKTIAATRELERGGVPLSAVFRGFDFAASVQHHANPEVAAHLGTISQSFRQVNGVGEAGFIALCPHIVIDHLKT